MGVMLGYSIPLLFLTLFATANPFNSAVHGGICTESKKSTLLIVFGDSFFDVGYGNEELCLPSKGQPYGKSLDLQQVAPGRFSDGLLVPDYIAKHLGLDNNGRIASYKHNLDIQQTLLGQGKGYASLSFAMAGAGVKQSADKSKSLSNQVDIFLDNSKKFFVGSGAKFVGKQDETLYLFSIDGCGHSDEKGCNDPTAYVFWDGMHNTQHINQEIARIFWNGPTDTTFPQNLQTLAGGRPPRNEVDEQEDTQLSEPGLNDFRPMPRNLFPEHFQVPTGTRQRQPRPGNLQQERPERSAEPARTTELEERTRVLEMAMGKTLARLIPDDPLIPLLNRDGQPATVVATRNSLALSNIVLAKLFSNKFASQREIKRTATELMQVNQKEGESLRDYMQRFNKATLDIDNVLDTICLSALLHDLKRGRFLDDLVKNPPKTWNKVSDRSASFILSEDFQSSKQRADDKSQILAQIQHWIRRPPPPLHDSSRADKSKHCDYHRVYGHNTEDCQHLKDELEFLARNGKLEGYVQKLHTQQPTQAHFVQGYDRPQGQRYQLGGAQDAHQDNQYPSEEGRAYRGRQFNRRGQGQRTTTQNQKDRKGVGYAGIPPPSGTINMISGGIHSGGQSARGRKAYACQVMTVNKNRPLKRPFEEAEWENTPITFSPADYKRAEGEPDIMMPHVDPFVATVHIGNHNVNKVFINTGSSPDILYWSCFQKMKLNPSSLQKYERPIYGFDNQPVPVEGVITLPIYGYSLRAEGCHLITPSLHEIPNSSRGSENHRPTQLGQQTMSISDIEHRPEGVEQKAKPVKPVETIPLDPDVPEMTIKIGTTLTEEERAELLEFLRINQDVFAWTTDEMPGIPAGLTIHKLSTDPTRRSVIQKRHLFGPEKQAAIDEEIQKLLQAGFIKRVEYSEWVSNPVLVKKPNGKWRMCIDFTNLNDACPKDLHPLPNVEKLVERAAGHERMSFLDASSGYHQVQLLLDDQKKTAFYAGDAIYCYVMMPFGLKNVGATYQKLVQIIFKLQIGRNIEVYVDDMIVTSVRAEDHISDLSETFQNLRRAQMKLNPLKCTFAVESGKFLGYVVSKKGIEVNPEKVQAVQQMEPPRIVKDVQHLTGRVTEEAVSSVLLREENKNQKPICYVSKVLQDAEQNYPLAEKAAFALVCTAHKVRAYFQSHRIVVYTDLPLRKILQKPELSGRLIGWSVELSEYNLKFQPRTTIKGQAVADFPVECVSATVKEKAPEHPIWVLYVDSPANIEGSGAGAVLLGPDGFKSKHALRFKFQITNNAAEYEALIYGLKLASELKVQSIQVFSNSQLVMGQVKGSCEIRDPQLGRYTFVVDRLKSRFASFQIDKIPKADNQRADELSKLASSTDPSSPSWTTPLINYLQSGELPENPSAATLIKPRAAHFTLLDNQLYKRAASMPLLRCLTPYEAEYAVREVHEGVCGTHIGGKTLARKLLRHGYYWPTMVEDAQSYVKKCPTCQFNADEIHMPGEMLSSLSSPWPFAQWGVDLLSPFVKGKGGCTYLVVAVDYFTKWIEAKPLSTTTEKKIEEFLFNSILCSDYGIELALTSVYTPQSNGQAESANKIILRGLKTRVLAAHSNWVDELHKVLWSCRTTPSSATGETPFSLAYGAEAVIPVEVGLPSGRSDRHGDPNNEQLLRENLDIVEEVREMSRIKNMAYRGRVAKFYNKRVRARQFKVGDLVLRKAGLTNTYSHMGKLAPNWEGPYMVIQIKRPGSYVLADIQGRQLPYIWNVHNLRRFYS
ncbi:hypothetical protein SLEP1_g39649 [Rubroshorea leprosula]|uniref:Uncharacterized protein n=1 Tax=Rubroshorea leprosula TaxID=152421 RepID=A0AAV5L0U6_9ROSI|nr:hypothetical protein SLEP1_g39649 [Rubroshorea leprosula]